MSETPIETALASLLKKQLAQEPISVAAFIDACLHHPEHGYYRNQTAIGAKADFITAPEISQVFGELIGLWAAITWKAMGSPDTVNLVEIGPGRGTMMKDALRALKVVPAFRSSVQVHLIEANPILCDLQAQTLDDETVPLTWHRDLKTALGPGGAIPAGATILIANEFLDTFPVEQYVYQDSKWWTRFVALEDTALSFQPSTKAASLKLPAALAGQQHDNDVFEISPGIATFASETLAPRAVAAPLAALFIDYGHIKSGFGETLQAVKDHKPVSPFHAPGESDLTAQVDFEAFGQHCLGAEADGIRPLEVDGPVTQAEFLNALGINERAFRLMAANPELAGRLETGVSRLMAPIGMGGRFKVCAVRSKKLPPLIGIA
ncbi:MAG: class I SAM-dependent methyltransferase [Hyphomicrobiaceae bacterium]